MSPHPPARPDPHDPRVAVCAAGEAAWHAAAYAGLGVGWRDDGELARGDTVPHPALFAAVTLTPRPALPDDLAPGILDDSWGALDHTDLPGRQAVDGDPWMLREPGPCALPDVPGLVVEPTHDVLLFERISLEVFTGRPPRTPGELHPPGSDAVPGTTMLLAVLDGEPVGAAIAVRHRRGVGVSGVAVLPGARRRGVGAALTAAAIATAPGLPATLCASDEGYGVYARLGFVDVGRGLRWGPAGALAPPGH